SFWGFYILSLVGVYQIVRGWGNVVEAFRVPAVLYALTFILALVTWGILVLARAAGKPKQVAA
ncbi:MAG: hypothetical protein JNM81_02400, partial [Rhodospirillaceae bacterium]|nr:hypothetical protein [Rhodospirillaceae bacterium]